MPRPLRIAVVGAGFGARIQVPGLRAGGRFDVTAIVGRDAVRTRAVAEHVGVAHALTSLDDALADCDAVSIATPPSTHAAFAIAAARAGRHVLCEKPMARDVGEATAMRDAVRTAGVVGMIDFEFRFHPARAMLGRLIARGDLGAPRLATCVDTLPLYVAPYKEPPAWWYDADAGGGWLGASGSHLIDAVRVWLGEVGAATALVETLGRGSADDTFALLLRMASGARAVLHQSAAVLGPRFSAMRVAGADATAWIDDAWDLWLAGRTGTPARVAIDADLAPPPVEIPPGAGPFAARELPSFVRLAEAFADAIERGPRPAGAPAPATFDDGVACQRVIDAARTASRAQRWVEVSPASP
ncbi:MAG TPA: Gfo/Idh/MocA family oxidoreductase [Candidatus Eisenbacteria bacterium]|nr:Gfo/Idh/MocA family oxidoreductase [Candidatus Eisenbacteria bacterium]